MTTKYGRAAATAALLTAAFTAEAAPIEKGASLPNIKGADVQGRLVDVEALVQSEERPYLLVVFLFQPGAGDDLANKLRALDEQHGGNVLKCIAVGVESDAGALAGFAERMGIQYHLLPASALEDGAWTREVTTLPMTVFVQPDESRRIERVLAGGGTAKAQLLKEIAENLFQQRREEALAVADLAIASGEDPAAARAIKGFYLSEAGRLDEAEREFGEIGSGAGLASVALARGDLAAAETLARASEEPYARAVLGEALLYQGKTQAAQAALAEAQSGAAEGWQQARAVNLQGRAAQAEGDLDAAIGHYRQSVALDGYNIVALSNEGAARLERAAPGDLNTARASLEQASRQGGGDAMTQAMLAQVLAAQAQAADTQRGELIRAQIASLKARFEELKAQGLSEPADPWSSRPMVLALLEGERGPMVFPRAGTELLLRRELEAALMNSGKAAVVERDMLDALLRELELGSSDLARGDTQQRLGQVLAAGHLAQLQFAMSGPERRLLLRIVDTETTELVYQASFVIDPADPVAAVPAILERLATEFLDGRELKGLIADAESDAEVVINLGRGHGVTKGQEFTVYEDGAPVEVGGRVVAVRQRPIATIAVAEVEDGYAVCTVTQKRDGALLAPEMKIKSGGA